MSEEVKKEEWLEEFEKLFSPYKQNISNENYQVLIDAYNNEPDEFVFTKIFDTYDMAPIATLKIKNPHHLSRKDFVDFMNQLLQVQSINTSKDDNMLKIMGIDNSLNIQKTQHIVVVKALAKYAKINNIDVKIIENNGEEEVDKDSQFLSLDGKQMVAIAVGIYLIFAIKKKFAQANVK